MKKFLNKFETQSIYEAEKNSLISPNVSLIADTKNVKYKPYPPKLFDYLYEDLSYGPKNFAKTAIGICVIPSGVLPDGKARFMSLNGMSLTSPDVGILDNDYGSIFWGGYGSDITELTNYETVVTGNTWYGYLPKDGSYSNIPYIPSPIDEFSEYSSAGATSDFDGKANTEKILAIDNSRSIEWQEAQSIINTYDYSYIHPGAQCCWRYNPGLTNQGDWYLPSAGELGFIFPNFSKLQTAIADVGGYKLSNFATYLSSTEGNSESCWALNNNIESLTFRYKDTKSSIRAFLIL